MEDRDAWDRDLLTVIAVVGDFQLDDRFVADVPFVHDLMMQARDRRIEFGYPRADLLDTDQGLAVAENNSSVLGEKGGYRRNIHRVDRREDVARVWTGCGAHGDPFLALALPCPITIDDLSCLLQGGGCGRG